MRRVIFARPLPRSIPRSNSIGCTTRSVCPSRAAAAVIWSVHPGFGGGDDVRVSSARSRRPCARRDRRAGSGCTRLKMPALPQQISALGDRHDRDAGNRREQVARLAAHALAVGEMARVVIRDAQSAADAAAPAPVQADQHLGDVAHLGARTPARAPPTPDRPRAGRRTPSSSTRSRRR